MPCGPQILSLLRIPFRHVRAVSLLEHDPFRLNRIMLWILLFDRVFYGDRFPLRRKTLWCRGSEIRFIIAASPASEFLNQTTLES